MKFGCDNCGAQYLIADEKLGPKGVKVRCKKCSHVIIVRPPGYAKKRPRRAARPSATGVQVFGLAGSQSSGEATVTTRAPKSAGAAPVPRADGPAALSLDLDPRNTSDLENELSPFAGEREGGSLDIVPPPDENVMAPFGATEGLSPLSPEGPDAAPAMTVQEERKPIRESRRRPPTPPPDSSKAPTPTPNDGIDLPASSDGDLIARGERQTSEEAQAEAPAPARDPRSISDLDELAFGGSPPSSEAGGFEHRGPTQGSDDVLTEDLSAPPVRERAHLTPADRDPQGSEQAESVVFEQPTSQAFSSGTAEVQFDWPEAPATPDADKSLLSAASSPLPTEPPSPLATEPPRKVPAVDPHLDPTVRIEETPLIQEREEVPNRTNGEDREGALGLEMSDDLARELGTAFEAMFSSEVQPPAETKAKPGAEVVPMLDDVLSGEPFSFGADPAPETEGGFSPAPSPSADAGAQSDLGHSAEGDEGDKRDGDVDLAGDALAGSITSSASLAPSSPAPAGSPREPSAVLPGMSDDLAENPTGSWFVAIRDEQVGPLDMAGLEARWAGGELAHDSLCWRPGMSDWTPIGQVSELRRLGPPMPRPVSASMGASEDVAVEPPKIAPVDVAPESFESPGASAPALGWRPSAASALASLAAEEFSIESSGSEPVSVDALPGPPAGEALEKLLASSGDGRPTATLFGADEKSVAEMRPLPRGIDTIGSYPLRDPVEEKSKSRSGVGVLVGAILGGMVLVGLIVAGALFYLRNTDTSKPEEEKRGDGPATLPRRSGSETPAPEPVVAGMPGSGSTPAGRSPTPDLSAASPPIQGSRSLDAAAQKAGAGTAPDDPSSTTTPPSSPTKADDRGSGKSRRSTRASRRRANRRRRAAARRASRESENSPAVVPTAPPPAGDEADLLRPGRTRDAPPPPSLKKQLDESDLFGVMRQHRSEILRCRERQVVADPTLDGTMTVEMVIQRSGRPTRVRVTPPKFRTAPIGTCVANAVKGWRFPRFSGRAMPVDFPVRVGGSR